MQANPETRIKLAALLSQSGDARAAVAELRRAVASEPDSTEALNNLAWLLATAADATVRDGAEALRLAEQACRLTANQQALPLGTLAAACAETGRFSEAIAAAQRAIALARASGDGHFAAVNEQLLAYYRAGKAFHEQKKPDR